MRHVDQFQQEGQKVYSSKGGIRGHDSVLRGVSLALLGVRLTLGGFGRIHDNEEESRALQPPLSLLKYLFRLNHKYLCSLDKEGSKMERVNMDSILD